MHTRRDRDAVVLYLTGVLSEDEAAGRADLPRAQFREYARTSGIVAPAPIAPIDDTAGERERGKNR